MHINLGYYTNDKRKVGKTITFNNEFTGCFIKSGTSIINPTIVLRLSDSLEGNVKQSNYCYIPQTGRYYFINDYITNTNKQLELSLNVDVLETYKDVILNSIQLVTRQEKKRNNKIIDSNIPINSDYGIKVIKFGDSPFKNLGTGNSVILTTTGNGGGESGTV